MYSRARKTKIFMETATKTKPSMTTSILRTITVFCVLMALAALAACNKEKVMTFDPTDCVYFATPADTSRFSFALLENPEAESALFTISVDLAGAPAGRDRIFHADVLKNATNSATKYEIIEPSVIAANETTGTIEIRVWRTPNLDAARDTITIVLKGSADLIADYVGHSTRCVTFYNKIDRPEWWYETNYGNYHEIKMQVLQEVLGSMDDPYTDRFGWYYYQAILNDYCDRNNLTYPGTELPVRFARGY